MSTAAPPAEDFSKYRDEVERLKSFLLQLDAEINEDSVKTRQNIEELEANLAERDKIIRELQREEEPDFALIVEQLHAENEKLKEIIMRQEGSIEELTEKNNNLQTALVMLQSKARKKVLDLEKRLAEKTVCDASPEEMNMLRGEISALIKGENKEGRDGSIDKYVFPYSDTIGVTSDHCSFHSSAHHQRSLTPKSG
ncbi:hypothetical protein PSACC_00834 [Paramicrosporidium saccamoebae]|uniref:Uncharacterized protein n=1 Tax=Paramicrosporidium saccamoebae TaxID=1246581 RepID=A0A2H9TNR7_9FUNG|nr:hypothetical protein PSACC_00834 [Paramicrosporidium saccamoebae]